MLFFSLPAYMSDGVKLSFSVLFSLFTLAVKMKSVCVCVSKWSNPHQSRLFFPPLEPCQASSSTALHPSACIWLRHTPPAAWEDRTYCNLLKSPLPPTTPSAPPPLLCPQCSMLILLASVVKWCSLLVIEHPLPGCWHMENAAINACANSPSKHPRVDKKDAPQWSECRGPCVPLTSRLLSEGARLHPPGFSISEMMLNLTR